PPPGASPASATTPERALQYSPVVPRKIGSGFDCRQESHASRESTESISRRPTICRPQPPQYDVDFPEYTRTERRLDHLLCQPTFPQSRPRVCADPLVDHRTL